MKKIAYFVLAALLAVSVTACKQQNESSSQTSVEESSVQSSVDEISETESQNETMPNIPEYSEDISEESTESEFIPPVQTTVDDYESVVVNNKCRLLLYKGTEQRIFFPDKVTVDGKEYETEIGPGCFRDTNIISLTLPDNITVIPESMCENCQMLEQVTFANVETIEKNAFWKCENWKFIFPDLNFGDQTKIKRIGECAFGFTGLYGKVTIRPDMELDVGAFQVCEKIEEVEIQKRHNRDPRKSICRKQQNEKNNSPRNTNKNWRSCVYI